jgi:type II secretory pathway component PulF
MTWSTVTTEQLCQAKMSSPSLEEVLALNEELAALDEAGIPIELGDSNRPTNESLAKINSSLALRTSLGQPVDTALVEDAELPMIYRYAMLTGLEANQPSLTLDGVSWQPAAWKDFHRTLGRALLQPLILVVLAYFGFIFLCLWFAPMLAEMYEQVQQEPNIGVRILMFCRRWMSVWVPLVPLLLAVGIFLWNSPRKVVRPHLLASRHYLRTVTNAVFAEQLASLLTSGVPFAESVRTAANASGDPDLMAAGAVVATHERGTPLPAAVAQKLAVFPPLLRWALTQDLGGESLPDMLRFIGETYRQSAERKASIWQVALPTFLGALIGGLILLAFSLSMFGPYIGLLYDLASGGME